MSYLSVCAVFRDEAPYLAEFLEFHLLQGVQHFYLYNHRSKDNYWEVLKPYVEQGIVTMINFPHDPPQFKAYDNCIEAFGRENAWIAFLDIDEFLLGTQGTAREFVQDVDRRMDARSMCVGAIAAHWVLFGSNGHETKTEGLVIERFTKRATHPDRHVKSIVRMSASPSVGKNPHYFNIRRTNTAIDENWNRLEVNYSLCEPATADFLLLAHFHLKSREEYFLRKQLPDSGSGQKNTNLEERFRVHDLNEVEDLRLNKFASAIKKAIEHRHEKRS